MMGAMLAPFIQHRASTVPLRVAVIGGGINGVMTAWALARDGHEVRVIERGRAMGATSSASTKLLHGGLRYLENGEFRLVRESLRERAWWIREAPRIAHPLQLALPVYDWSRRARLTVRLGLGLYGLLAGGRGLGPSRWHDRESLLRLLPDLRPTGLVGGFTFYDGQMDDLALGAWAVAQARAAGVRVDEQVPVERIDEQGTVWIGGQGTGYDRIVNAAGPWTRSLLNASGIPAGHDLDLVRGSHLVIDRPLAIGVLAEVRGERRVAFALPWKGRTLVGTTERRQGLGEPVACSADEVDYLLRFHAAIFRQPAGAGEVVERFAGLRPLVRSSADPNRATREYAIETRGRVTSVFGGKWTTARALGEQVARQVAGRR
jgi:glycerol-3-phosphate dehydrogenase